MANSVSDKVKDDALKIAKGTQKPGQTKEQTKLISLGIEKGIAEYKKQQKAKARELDKQRKKDLKEKQREQENSQPAPEAEVKGMSASKLIPWTLLILSWVGFIGYELIFS